ncbi:DnaJ homolog subfamily C member 7 homolog [Durusdinium trenchii]|uniref:DnaJ homolog subfamily C member 7 homolog n=1 Tax=Durusdinium trenchii TaxID=1381693 RepID=A0ABP0LH36_9DINO
MAAATMLSSRMHSLARDLENQERRQRTIKNKLESEVANLRIEVSEAQNRAEEAEEQREELETKLREQREQEEAFKDEQRSREKDLLREIVALRFELAHKSSALRKEERKAAVLSGLLNDGDGNPTQAASDAVKSLFTLPKVDPKEDANKADAGNPAGSAGDGEEAEEEAAADLMDADAFVDAAKRGLFGVLRNVLKAEVNESRLDRLNKVMGRTLLEVAGQGPGALESIKALLDFGADVNACHPAEQGGRSVIHMAAAKGHGPVLATLLAVKGVDLDKQDARGRTALHLSARLRKPDTTKLLLRKGADSSIETPEGKTAQALAANSENAQWFSLSFSPMTIKQVFETPSLQFWNRSGLGLRRYKEERWKDAFEHFGAAIEVVRAHPKVTTRLDLSRLLRNHAKAALRLGEILAALRDCDEALEIDNTYEGVLEMRADCHWQLFDFARAAQDYETLRSTTSDKEKRAVFKERLEKAARSRDATHYDVLGIKTKASSAQIKRAFRQESIKWHPDKHNRSGEDAHRAQIQFQRINEAREVLANESKRRAYDFGTLRNRSNRSNYFYDDLYNFSEDDDDDDDDSDRSETEFPWNDEVLSTPLAHGKLSFRESQRLREEQNAEKQRQEEERKRESEARMQSLFEQEEREQQEKEWQRQREQEQQAQQKQHEQEAQQPQKAQQEQTKQEDESEDEELETDNSEDDDHELNDSFEAQIRSLGKKYGFDPDEGEFDDEDQAQDVMPVEWHTSFLRRMADMEAAGMFDPVAFSGDCEDEEEQANSSGSEADEAASVGSVGQPRKRMPKEEGSNDGDARSSASSTPLTGEQATEQEAEAEAEQTLGQNDTPTKDEAPSSGADAGENLAAPVPPLASEEAPPTPMTAGENMSPNSPSKATFVPGMLGSGSAKGRKSHRRARNRHRKASP